MPDNFPAYPTISCEVTDPPVSPYFYGDEGAYSVTIRLRSGNDRHLADGYRTVRLWFADAVGEGPSVTPSATITFTVGETLEVPVLGVPYEIITDDSGSITMLIEVQGTYYLAIEDRGEVFYTSALYGVDGVDVTDVAVAADDSGEVTWTFDTAVASAASPTPELEIHTASGWFAPLTSVISGDNLVCTYAASVAELKAATQWRIASAPTDLVFDGSLTAHYPQIGVPTLPP